MCVIVFGLCISAVFRFYTWGQINTHNWQWQNQYAKCIWSIYIELRLRLVHTILQGDRFRTARFSCVLHLSSTLFTFWFTLCRMFSIGSQTEYSVKCNVIKSTCNLYLVGERLLVMWSRRCLKEHWVHRKQRTLVILNQPKPANRSLFTSLFQNVFTKSSWMNCVDCSFHVWR